jgi:hypothetical protein
MKEGFSQVSVFGRRTSSVYSTAGEETAMPPSPTEASSKKLGLLGFILNNGPVVDTTALIVVQDLFRNVIWLSKSGRTTDDCWSCRLRNINLGLLRVGSAGICH